MTSVPTTSATPARARAYYVLARRNGAIRLGGDADYGSRRIARWDGRRGIGDLPATKPIWPKVAAFCNANRHDPGLLVRAAFAARPADAPPMPTMLLGARARLAWSEFGRTAAADFRRHLSVRQKIFLVAAGRDAILLGGTRATAAARVIRDASVGLSALFRHRAASAADDRDAASRFATRALVQYLLGRPAYGEAWGDFLPPRLRDAADRRLVQVDAAAARDGSRRWAGVAATGPAHARGGHWTRTRSRTSSSTSSETARSATGPAPVRPEYLPKPRVRGCEGIGRVIRPEASA